MCGDKVGGHGIFLKCQIGPVIEETANGHPAAWKWLRTDESFSKEKECLKRIRL
jgi:hypothetical protein